MGFISAMLVEWRHVQGDDFYKFSDNRLFLTYFLVLLESYFLFTDNDWLYALQLIIPRISSYKALYGKFGGFVSDIVAAIDQVSF